MTSHVLGPWGAILTHEMGAEGEARPKEGVSKRQYTGGPSWGLYPHMLKTGNHTQHSGLPDRDRRGGGTGVGGHRWAAKPGSTDTPRCAQAGPAWLPGDPRP